MSIYYCLLLVNKTKWQNFIIEGHIGLWYFAWVSRPNVWDH